MSSTAPSDGAGVVAVVVVAAAEFAEWAFVDHPALAEHHRAIEQRRQSADLVQDHQHRDPASDQLAEDVGQHLLVLEVDPGVRLVQEEQLRLTSQCSGDQHALLLAARQAPAARPRPDRPCRPSSALRSRAPDRSAAKGGTPADGPADRRRPPRGPARCSSEAVERCGTYPIRFQVRKLANGVPNSSTEPRWCAVSPSSARTRVDLPEPLPPSRVTASPPLTVRPTPRSTGSPPSWTLRSLRDERRSGC